jgi:dienelactone hydrolase
MTILLVLGCVCARGEVVSNAVIYEDEGVELEGVFFYDDSISGERPGIMVVHEWTGIGNFVKTKAAELAEQGFVAFCADIYGKNIRPQTSKEAAEQAGIYRSDRELMRQRAIAGLRELKKHGRVLPGKVAAIGYCFGGGTVLELARSGADVKGVVSFHGNLDTPDPEDAQNIKAKVMVFHGADDPHVPKEQVDAFIAEMKSADVNWQLNMYGGAVHSFTNPSSGNDPSTGVAYDRQADIRSWENMKLFFSEIF